ncbi:MAG: YbcC family protein [Myxococcaceae bacterium]
MNTTALSHRKQTQVPPELSSALDDATRAAIQGACGRIAPSWPLDRVIAVNPFWGLIELPVAAAAAKLRSLSGAQLLMPRAFYRDAYRRGALRDEHLQEALRASGSNATLGHLQFLLVENEPQVGRRARVVDVVDATRDLSHAPSWVTFVTQSISQFCASYFDDGQATFSPSREGGLYASWRRHALNDHSPALLMGAQVYRSAVRELPVTGQDLIAKAMSVLAVEASDQEDYFWSLLLDVNGWASWCAYRRWMARLEGTDDDAISDLLAIRLAWDWLLHRIAGDNGARRWTVAKAVWPIIDAEVSGARTTDWLLQSAMEIAWREPVIRALPDGFVASRPAEPPVQSVFCIDVRSESFRRALEAAAPTVQTLGFAGFFGLPMDYQPLGAIAARPQLPGLLAPRMRVFDTGLSLQEAGRRSDYVKHTSTWRSFKTDALSTFTFVETLGLTYAADLLKATLGIADHAKQSRMGLSRGSEAKRKPRLTGSVVGESLSADARCDLALGMLRGMSLTHNFARVVLLVGHGSSTRNNPHAAGLDCGACCGQTGEVNARAAAALLNDPSVRVGLAQRGISIPDTTRFVAALHNTTTDEVEFFELDDVPNSHAHDIETLRGWLIEAGARARAERAARLGLEGLDAEHLSRAVKTRTRDWAEVRPEWGLANNAAFIVAPREHCRHLNLEGRSFLHEYRHEEDTDYAVLELIMTAPMVVTHWINFQYYASTVDNLRYGSGNKVLHNVVGGHIGVFEGNSGDLRIGLPIQSLHDGTTWVHTPLRLSVFIEAPRPAIDGVLNKHTTVRNLVTNGWLSLFQMDEKEGAVYALEEMQWRRF